MVGLGLGLVEGTEVLLAPGLAGACVVEGFVGSGVLVLVLLGAAVVGTGVSEGVVVGAAVVGVGARQT